MGRINFIHSQKKIKNAWQADCYVRGKRIRRCYPTREEAEKALEQLEQGIIPPADYKGPKAEIPVRLLRPYFEEWKGDRSIWTEGNKSLPDGVSLVTVFIRGVLTSQSLDEQTSCIWDTTSCC